MTRDEVNDYLMGNNASTRALNRRLGLPEMSEEEYRIQVRAVQLLKDKGYVRREPGETIATIFVGLFKVIAFVLTFGILIWWGRPYYRRRYW